MIRALLVAIPIGGLIAGWVWWTRPPTAFLLHSKRPGEPAAVVVGLPSDHHAVVFRGRGRTMVPNERMIDGNAYRFRLPLGADLRSGVTLDDGRERFRFADLSAPNLLGPPPGAKDEGAGVVVERIAWRGDGRLSVVLREPIASVAHLSGLTSRYAKDDSPDLEPRSRTDRRLRFVLPDNLLVEGDEVDVLGGRSFGTWEETTFGEHENVVQFPSYSFRVTRGKAGTVIPRWTLPDDVALYTIQKDVLTPVDRMSGSPTTLRLSSGRLLAFRYGRSEPFRVRLTVPPRKGTLSAARRG